MGFSGHQSNPHIGDLRSGQHAPVLLFFQMRQNQSLPIQIQFIRAAVCGKLQAAARLPRFQKKMHLRIVTQRFKMPYSLHRRSNRFLIDDAAGTEFYPNAKTIPDHTL